MTEQQLKNKLKEIQEFRKEVKEYLDRRDNSKWWEFWKRPAPSWEYYFSVVDADIQEMLIFNMLHDKPTTATTKSGSESFKG